MQLRRSPIKQRGHVGTRQPSHKYHNPGLYMYLRDAKRMMLCETERTRRIEKAVAAPHDRVESVVLDLLRNCAEIARHPDYRAEQGCQAVCLSMMAKTDGSSSTSEVLPCSDSFFEIPFQQVVVARGDYVSNRRRDSAIDESCDYFSSLQHMAGCSAAEREMSQFARSITSTDISRAVRGVTGTSSRLFTTDSGTLRREAEDTSTIKVGCQGQNFQNELRHQGI
jgi:hypothetical protein